MADRVAELETELARVCAERDELARRLKDAERYRTAVDVAQIPIMCVSAIEGRYLFANQAFANAIGWTVDEILSGDAYQIWLDVTHPDDLEVERRAVERLARGEADKARHEKRLVHRNGQARWYAVDVTAVRAPDGRLESIIVQFTDVHEQRDAAEIREQLEAELRQKQKLEALGKLAGGVAHDFNNRLVIIMGYTELLKRSLPEDGTLAQHADMVLTSAQRAAELTHQLLAYSRRQVLMPRAFDLNETVDRMRRLLERLIGEDIQLVTSLAAEHPIFGDPGQIEQVILNLALNARDAMPNGGKLMLETSDASLGADNGEGLPSGDYVTLVVRDTGAGIPESVLPHIFEPFFTTKALGKGTGLGLATVDGIVHQSGGTIRVESRIGEGTAFTIRLPRANATAAAQAPSAPQPEPAMERPTRFESVLVCDDDDGVRKLVSDLLAFRGYRVLEACNGRDALELAARHDGPIELLVTDVVMPEMGGIELASQLKARFPRLRVLYVSGYSDDASLLSSPLEPGTFFLPKPFLPGDLTRAVYSILEAAG